MPLLCAQRQDSERASSARPALADLFKVFDTMNDVAAGIFVRKVEQMDCAGAMGDIDRDVADLAETMRSFVEAEELGNCSSGLGAEFSR